MKITSRTHILLIVLAIVAVFVNSLSNGFSWDDYDLVLTNPYIKSFDWVKSIFADQIYKTSDKDSNFYRPMQLLSYALEYPSWKLNPYGYHLTNLLLHLFNSIFVYLLVVSLGMPCVAAFFTALLFGVEPASSSTTYYISARSDLLAAFFIFLSLLCFLKYYRNKSLPYYVISILFFIFSVLSKEMALILPFLLILVIFKIKEKNGFSVFKYTAPYFLVILAYAVFRFLIINFHGDNNVIAPHTFTANFPLYVRLLTDIKVLARYIRLFFIPYPLHIEWFIEPVNSFFNRDVLMAVSMLIFFAAAVKKLFEKNRDVLFGILWFLIALLPVLNIYPISVFFGEGWLYLPSAGIFIIISIFFIDIIGVRFGNKARNVFFVLFLGYYAIFTLSYAGVWKDSISLFSNVLKYEKDNPFISRIYNNMAMTYYVKGRNKKAVEYYKEAVRISPRYKEAYNNMGVAYTALKRHVRAIHSFRKAINADRAYVQAYNNMGHAYADMGFDKKALEAIRRSLAIEPYYFPGYMSMGFIYSKANDFDGAISVLKKAKEIRPYYYEPYFCLGNIYIKKKMFKEALEEYERMAALVTVDYEFYNTLSFLYLKNNRLREAEVAIRKSLALNEKQSGVYGNLGNLNSACGKFDMALEDYRKALAMKADNKEAGEIMENARKAKSEWKQALRKSNAQRVRRKTGT